MPIKFLQFSAWSKEQFYGYALLLAVIAVPMNIRLSTYSILVLTISWLLVSSLKEKLVELKKNQHWVWPFFVYFLIQIGGLINSTNVHEGLKQLEKNSAIFVVPLIIGSCFSLSTREFTRLLWGFVLSCCFVLVVDFCIACILYYHHHDSSVFFYHQLSEINSPFEHNPIYLSFYLLFSIAICLMFFKGKNMSGFLPISIILLFIFFIVGIILLSSKTVFFALVVYAFYEAFLIVKDRQRIRFLVMVVVLPLSLVFLVGISPILKERYKEIINLENLEIVKDGSAYDFEKVNGLNLRLLFWKWGLKEAPPETWLFGQGTGDVEEYLNKVYEKHNLALTVSDGEKYGYYGYNVHNQFVQTFLKNGFVGLLSLLLLFTVPLLQRIRLKDRLFVLLILMLLTVSITESLLETNKGIVFLAVFVSVFCKKSEEHKIASQALSSSASMN